MREWKVAGLDRLARTAQNAATGSWLAFSGHPLLKRGASGSDDPSQRLAARLLDLLEERGFAALGEVDGAFAIAWWSASRHELQLIRDRFGAEPLYYSDDAGQLSFASRIRDLVAARSIRPTVSAAGLAEFLVYCYLPGTGTLHDGVRRVPAGSSLVYSPSRGATVHRWYALSFAEPFTDDESAIALGYRAALERAVEVRLGPTDPGAFLSGGMDSSSAVTFARRHWPGEIKSFGFRCAGTSFDESVYARRLAEALAITHTEVEYGEQESVSILQAIPEMEVPFCDVGIEVGTWLLGGAAQGHVDYVLTGDGGDEIWASHPVYAAQKLMRWYDRLPIPRAFGDSAWRMASRLPDSDQKRDLAVILKRILPRPGIPAELRHFRWRAYSSVAELGELLTPEWAAKLHNTDPFECVRKSFEGYRGPDDGISPMLYSDYVTASGFYFSRLMLLRHFGITARTPFYDRELVEFGARIPARLKLEGIERTKRLFRVAMKGVLPDIVNERVDKLGHSVPLKNWLRAHSALNSLLESTLAKKALEARGMFRADAVGRLLEEHRARRHNHSHRLWAILVLEHWLQSHVD
jgi:asparagine synthase (glutamine-hydrolysing)